MRSPPVVAVAGATGAVGLEILRVLEERDVPLAGLRLLASPRSRGRTLPFRGGDVAVEVLGEDSFEGVDLALFAAGGSTAREWAPRAVAAGTTVIDNSSAFRLDPEVPLVVPEVGTGALRDHRGLIANPNCSTILLVMALAPLHRAVGLRRVTVATYQAASGAGQKAIDELRQGTRAALAGESFVPEVLPASLAFNLFPHVDVLGADGYTREEDKMLHETRKLLGAPDLPVEATCVRVPVERCHCEAVTVELERAIAPEDARALWRAAPGVEIDDDPAEGRYPMPAPLAGTDPVVVGRIRSSRLFDNGLTFWLAGDQLRKGAALNTVQIAECLMG